MKSKKITSIKQARRIIEQSGILEINEDDGTVDANLVTWWDGNDDINELGYLYRGRKSRKIYMPVKPNPSELRAIAKVFNYEIVCNLYGEDGMGDISILWLKETVNECTS